MGINLDVLIAAASRKTGLPEEKIRNAVNSGDVSELRSFLGAREQEKFDKTMNDGRLTEEIRRKYMKDGRR